MIEMIEFGENIIGDNIYRYRDRLGLSQKALANMVGVEPGSISMFEKSSMQPGIHTLQKLADALGVTVDHLISNPYRDIEKDKTLELKTYLLKMNAKQLEKFSELLDYMIEKNIHISQGKQE